MFRAKVSGRGRELLPDDLVQDLIQLAEIATCKDNLLALISHVLSCVSDEHILKALIYGPNPFDPATLALMEVLNGGETITILIEFSLDPKT